MRGLTAGNDMHWNCAE